ncbi:hypothetical protein, partial [Mycobacterium simiae]|uniref:hypothetical protein n=1 Tax=Mycobacterium simiae TaxID=1784 RepID=UPI00165EF6F7
RVPEIPLHVVGTIPINIPITSTFTDTVYSGMTIAEVPFGFTVGIGPVPAFTGVINALTIPQITIVGPVPPPHATIGGPNTAIDITGFASVGPVDWTLLSIEGQPGLGNSTGLPSSGFFNSGTGTSSGFLNTGASNSGFNNVNFGNSGVGNIGALQSGMANLGNSVSGLMNASPLDLSRPANLSGLQNVGVNLAGLLRDGTNGTTINIGLANLGGLNLGSANIGGLNLGNANVGGDNLGSGNR